MPIRCLCLIALWLSAAGAHAATRIDLTRDWSFRVDFTPKGATELPFFPLRDYQLTWQLVDAENRALASGARPFDTQAFTLEQAMPSRKPGPVRLVVELLRPDSTVAMERTLAAP